MKDNCFTEFCCFLSNINMFDLNSYSSQNITLNSAFSFSRGTMTFYLCIQISPQSSKVMLKILQARLQQYVNHETPDVQAGFRKGRGAREQIANIHWIIEKARKFQKKKSTSASLTTPKPLTMDHNKVWKILKEREYQTT